MTGNKIRKFQFLLQDEKKKKGIVPPLVISYGGIQSNAMNAISMIASKVLFGEFLYFVKRYPKYLRKDPPIGNLPNSLKNGMRIIEIDSESYRKREAIPKSLHAFPREHLPREIDQSPTLRLRNYCDPMRRYQR